MLANNRINRMEHLTHPRFWNRAFHHHNQFWFVWGGAHKPPCAILNNDTHAIDCYEITDFLSREHLASFCHRLKIGNHFINNAIFDFIVTMRRHCGRAPCLRQILIQIRHGLCGIAIEHINHMKYPYMINAFGGIDSPFSKPTAIENIMDALFPSKKVYYTRAEVRDDQLSLA